MTKQALCFIFDKNYAHQGRYSIESAKKHNPNYDTILLTDYFDTKIADIQLSIEDINLSPNNWLLVGRIAIVEFCLKNLKYDTAIFIDGDTYSYSSFIDLQIATENHDIVIIPHITKPLPEDNLYPQNRTISFAGNYNTGVWSASLKGLSFLEWWKNQTAMYPITKPEIGLIAEQGWLRFANDFCNNPKVFRHPAYNVAYWNIKQRQLEIKDNQYYIDNKPLSIVHFSGLKRELNPSQMSIFQNRYILEKTDLAYTLFDEYYRLVWGD